MNMNLSKEEIKKLDDEYIVHTYGRSPLYADHASGVKVVDVDGNEFWISVPGSASRHLGTAMRTGRMP